jgi:mannose-6-phosphate isomerase
VAKDYFLNDSFVVYICIDGEFTISWEGNSEKVTKGETVLVPAMIKELTLKPVNQAKVLEVYINSENPI